MERSMVSGRVTPDQQRTCESPHVATNGFLRFYIPHPSFLIPHPSFVLFLHGASHCRRLNFCLPVSNLYNRPSVTLQPPSMNKVWPVT
jgi:hypothetical protein